MNQYANKRILIMKYNKTKLDSLIKLSAVIAIEHKTSLMGQKLFNVLFANAYANMSTQNIHTITVKELLKYIPSAHNVNHLRKTLKQMCIPVEYNLFAKDKEKWGFFALLPEANIKENTGVCEYSFTSTMVKMMAKSEKIYTKINLLIQQKYQGTKYGWFLYELCFDYKGTPGGKSPKMTIALLKKFLGIDPKKYTLFKRFHYEVLKPGIRDLNKYSNLHVEMKTYKEGRQVTHIQFVVKDKPPTIEATQKLDKSHYTILANCGVSDQAIKNITQKYSKEEIEHILLVYEEEKEQKGVIYPTAFFEKALLEGWNPKNSLTKAKKIPVIDTQQNKERAEKTATIFKSGSNEEKYVCLIDENEFFKRKVEKLNEMKKKVFKKEAYLIFDKHDNLKDMEGELMDKLSQLGE